ncbi:MAG TPA: hypothetical protein VLA13_00455 [Massilibacterium sp.]|nr:hypothetical protein [Massilibacterium sp.]
MMKVNIEGRKHDVVKHGQVRSNKRNQFVLVVKNDEEFDAITLHGYQKDNDFYLLFDGLGVDEETIKSNFPYVLEAELNIYDI